MDWEKVYERLENAIYEGKIVHNEDTINKIKSLTEWHRKMFVEYFDSTSTGKLKMKTYSTYRTAILYFLLQEHINNKYLSEITQIDIDDFLVNRSTEIGIRTLNGNSYALKNYFKFHSKHLTFEPQYVQFNKKDFKPENEARPLNSRELELIRYSIRNKPLLKFIFELAYENGVRFEDSREYYSETYDEEKQIFENQNGHIIKLSNRLIEIIDRIKESEEFKNPHYKQGFSFEVLKDVIASNGFNRPLKSNDVNKTYNDKTSFCCPECGMRYEAIADNWVIKQYHEGGNMWIVCRKCGVLASV